MEDPMLAAVATIIAATIAAVAAIFTAMVSSRIQKEVSLGSREIAKSNQESQERIAKDTREQIATLEPTMESLRHELESNRESGSFKRHRVHHLLDDINDAYSELNVVIEIACRQVWIYGQPSNIDERIIDLETKFHKHTARVETSLRSLEAFQLIDASETRDLVRKLKSVWSEKFMSELCMHVPAVSKLFKNREPDDSKILSGWVELKKTFDNLGNVVLKIPYLVSLDSKY